MTRFLGRASAALVIVTTTWLGSATAAGASCVGPSIRHDTGPVARGAALTVTGAGFGTNCYDTGPPPKGQGALGKPATGIELVIAQGDRRIVVARGDASPTYTFEATFVVPGVLEPGEATLTAAGTEIFGFVPRPLLISDAPRPPDLPEQVPVVELRPAPTTTDPARGAAPSTAADTADDGAARWPAFAAGGAVVAAGAVALIWLVARRRTR